MTRLTDDELDTLLLEHRSDCGCIPMCDDATCSYCDHLWPCEPWRLATEVKEWRDAPAGPFRVKRTRVPDLDLGYEEGGR